MAWVSFVVVALIFILGQEKLLPHEPFTFTVPLLQVPLNIPYSGYIRMLLYTLIIWGVLWIILRFLERLIGAKWLEKAGLRNGMLFATRPWEVNNLAVILAAFILGLTTLQIVLDFVSQLIRSNLLSYLFDSALRNLMGRGVPYVFDFNTGIIRTGELKFLPFEPNAPIIPVVTLLSGGAQPALPVPIFPCNVLVFCIFTLVVAFFFKREQRSRYAEEIKRNQSIRKSRQEEIKIPPTENQV